MVKLFFVGEWIDSLISINTRLSVNATILGLVQLVEHDSIDHGQCLQLQKTF